MSKGTVYDDPILRYNDPVSGREVIKLTEYMGHSNHLYFTDPCWFNNDRSFVFTSDRGNRSNLFRYDLDAFKATQLTDLGTNDDPRLSERRPGGAYSAARDRHYFWWHRLLIELNVDTLEERVVYEVSPEWEALHYATTSADGRYVVAVFKEPTTSDGPRIDFSYSRFVEFFENPPLTQIVRIDIDSGELTVLYEENRYITHINPSPRNPTLMTYCHEGPWDRVEQRIWGMNIETGEHWKIRPQDGQNVAVGHEYWLADGERIGYHGRPRTGEGKHVFGTIRADNSDHIEVLFPYDSVHFQSLDENLIVGDGTPAFSLPGDGIATPYIQLFRREDGEYTGPRVLSYHRSTFNDQHAHCHPRFTPDGKYIKYASDLTSYSNIYLVEVGDYETLPTMDDVLAKR